MPSWDVVCTVKAPKEQVESFVSHYLALGASRIFLWYDDPAFSYSFDDARVQVMTASPEQLANRPRDIETRQIRNATTSARESQSQWILHCDIDEFLDPNRPMAEILAETPPECLSIVIRTIEPVYREVPRTHADILAADLFKMPGRPENTRRFWAAAYGDVAAFSDEGFWAHRVGKSISRLSVLERFNKLPLHRFFRAKGDAVGVVKASDMFLRHFDALDFEAWLQKHSQRVTGLVHAPLAGPLRDRQSQYIHQVYTEQGLDAAFDLYSRMMVFPERMIARGIKRGLLAERKPLSQAE